MASETLETPYLTVEERIGFGRAKRTEVPRSSHATWKAAPDRPSPVALLKEQAKARDQSLVPLRYERMGISPFTFYRGGALIMASDLATTPNIGLTVQLCGDAHIANFGGFASPERRLVFDINDFDETLPGPWEWDIKRLATSVEICGRNRGFKKNERKNVVRETVKSYREAMISFARMRNLDVWYAHLDVEDQLHELTAGASKKKVKNVRRGLDKTYQKTSEKAFMKLIEVADGKLRIISDPPVIVPLSELLSGVDAALTKQVILDLLTRYEKSLPFDRRCLVDQFSYIDAARKVVGVGSVGTQAWIIALCGQDETDPLVLQIKEAQPSVLERFVGKSEFENHGRRVVEGQRLMQASSDVMLGWAHGTDADGIERDFYVRQLWDWKGSADLETISLPDLTTTAAMCGWTLARAHARSGNRIAIASYLGAGDAFDRAIADFAYAYADQNQADFDEFVRTREAGEL
ncbi:MAG: DUF2252 domain-containing protein [Clostridia bacterium]